MSLFPIGKHCVCLTSSVLISPQSVKVPSHPHTPKEHRYSPLSCDSLKALLLLLLLNHFSRVQLCTTPETAAHQAPPSLGFSRQEHWSGLPFPSPSSALGFSFCHFLLKVLGTINWKIFWRLNGKTIHLYSHMMPCKLLIVFKACNRVEKVNTVFHIMRNAVWQLSHRKK